jgi:hypothetical protein
MNLHRNLPKLSLETQPDRARLKTHLSHGIMQVRPHDPRKNDFISTDTRSKRERRYPK